MRLDHDPPLTSATRDADRQFYPLRELWSDISQIGRDRTLTGRSGPGTSPARPKGLENHANLARGIRGAFQRLRFQRELWSKYEEIGRDAIHHEIIAFETAISHIDSPTPYRRAGRVSVAEGSNGPPSGHHSGVRSSAQAETRFHGEHQERRSSRPSREPLRGRPSPQAELRSQEDPWEHRSSHPSLQPLRGRPSPQTESRSHGEHQELRNSRPSLPLVRGRPSPQAETRSQGEHRELRSSRPSLQPLRGRQSPRAEARFHGKRRELRRARPAPESQGPAVDILPHLKRDVPRRMRTCWPLWAGLLMIIAGTVGTWIYARAPLGAALDSLWRDTQLMLSSTPFAAALYPASRPEAESAPVKAAARAPGAASRTASTLPLPDAYGLFAVSGGQLTRLESMRIRIPDTRVALPGLITKPSPVTLPDGRLFFIAYQRDLATNAPDAASVRVVAEVTRVLAFGPTGSPKVTPVENTWAIRAVSVDLTVAPVPESREMILIRPSVPNLSLSPGRYMLVFNNQAYDFSVAGDITDTAHCLERTETQDGDMYSECRELP